LAGLGDEPEERLEREEERRDRPLGFESLGGLFSLIYLHSLKNPISGIM
jgi:hypothetical protein